MSSPRAPTPHPTPPPFEKQVRLILWNCLEESVPMNPHRVLALDSAALSRWNHLLQGSWKRECVVVVKMFAALSLGRLVLSASVYVRLMGAISRVWKSIIFLPQRPGRPWPLSREAPWISALALHSVTSFIWSDMLRISGTSDSSLVSGGFFRMTISLNWFCCLCRLKPRWIVMIVWNLLRGVTHKLYIICIILFEDLNETYSFSCREWYRESACPA